MWKERLWQVFLVAILGLSLSMCSRSGGNNNPTVANAGVSEISQELEIHKSTVSRYVKRGKEEGIIKPLNS